MGTNSSCFEELKHLRVKKGRDEHVVTGGFCRLVSFHGILLIVGSSDVP